MTRVVTALSVSADGYIAGPNDGPGNPLGDGGLRLFSGTQTATRRAPSTRISSSPPRVRAY
jgi:hypothetical protein